MNSQLGAYYRLNGQPFHLPSSHTPIFVKGKADALVSSSLCTNDNTLQVIALGQHLIPNKGPIGSPFVNSNHKGSGVVNEVGGSYDNYTDLHKYNGQIGIIPGDSTDGNSGHF